MIVLMFSMVGIKILYSIVIYSVEQKLFHSNTLHIILLGGNTLEQACPTSNRL
jgi:hypothetical protein